MKYDVEQVAELAEGAKTIQFESMGETGIRGSVNPELGGLTVGYNPCFSIDASGDTTAPCLHARVLCRHEDHDLYQMCMVSPDLVFYQMPLFSDFELQDGKTVHEVVGWKMEGNDCKSKYNTMQAVMTHYANNAPCRVYMFRLPYQIHMDYHQKEDTDVGYFTPYVAPVKFGDHSATTEAFHTAGFRFYVEFQLGVVAESTEIMRSQPKDEGMSEWEMYKKMQEDAKKKKQGT